MAGASCWLLHQLDLVEKEVGGRRGLGNVPLRHLGSKRGHEIISKIGGACADREEWCVGPAQRGTECRVRTIGA